MDPALDSADKLFSYGLFLAIICERAEKELCQVFGMITGQR